ncbi:MAG: hypothetical protein H7138_14085, partial [Myxococcales bacterium]|nr:hypothetical protein [Myxococcales bacterium]
MKRLGALALFACLGACTGSVGTVDVGLTTAPGSVLLDRVERLRLTLTGTDQVVEAARTPAGFDLAFELDASEGTGALIVEGFDADGALNASGQSPKFPLTAINARVIIY